MDTVAHASTAYTRFVTLLMTLFGGSALLLASTGVYGVLSYGVQRRTREIGIRLAIGAPPGEIRRLILVHAMKAVVLGTAIGLGAAFGLTHVLSNLLFGVTPRDPVTFVTAPLVFGAVALLATWLPVRRATAIDPVATLRSD
jgi:ABC-type antimicrobial peptide transport system permease subunit